MANALNGSDRNILDSTNCVKLSSILESFNAPINEEQCWALCHQTIKTISTLIDKRPLYLLNGPSNLYINKDGFVHQKSFLESVDHKRLTPSLNKLIASIGATLFLALDYGLESQEERSLDPNLELLIDRLTCSTDDKEDENEDKESNDEGIERDSPEYEFGPLLIDGSNLVEQVLSVCNGRLGGAEEAEIHYRAVCRALVAEAMELSSFLHKITSVTEELKNGAISMSNSGGHHHHSRNRSDCADSSGALISLEGLRLADWARLWMQVIQELRQGVKLKKVSLTEKPSFEFELTPYEMLLDDIRSRRYKLNKVKVNGSSPSRVTKDAHDLILDFIRSRPPLVPASNRKLPPPPVREPSLFEKLLDSIRQQPKLKVIPAESINQRSSPIRLGRVREDNCDSTCNKNNNYEYNNNNNVNNNNIIINNNNNNNNHCNKISSSSSISLSISCSSTFTKTTSTTVKTASTKSSTSSSSSSAPITATTGLPSKLSQQQQARSSKQPKYILQEDPESLQGPKKKLVKSNLTLKILLSIDDDDDDIIQIQYK